MFLKTILPRKPVSELYTVLGRAKQGKTERYRELFRHLQQSTDQFVHAPGDRGLVMICFTLPSFDVVFKIIRDRFAYPKNVLREEVLQKYELVFKHDRAGRLVDAQEFKRLQVPEGALRRRAARGAAHRSGEHRALRGRRAHHRSHVHRAAHDAAQPVHAQRVSATTPSARCSTTASASAISRSRTSSPATCCSRTSA